MNNTRTHSPPWITLPFSSADSQIASRCNTRFSGFRDARPGSPSRRTRWRAASITWRAAASVSCSGAFIASRRARSSSSFVLRRAAERVVVCEACTMDTASLCTNPDHSKRALQNCAVPSRRAGRAVLSPTPSLRNRAVCVITQNFSISVCGENAFLLIQEEERR